MANQTLTGCMDFVTGLAKFDQDDCEYSGCLVIGGVHDKQVAVTVDTIRCDDIYYGCVNFPGGTFSVVIPGDCCLDVIIAPGGCDKCDFLDTPKYLRVIITGVSDCIDVCYARFPGSEENEGGLAEKVIRSGGPAWTLKLSSNCRYSNYIIGSFGQWQSYFNPGCSGAKILRISVAMGLSIFRLFDSGFSIALTASTGLTPAIGVGIMVFGSAKQSGVTFSTCMIPSSPINNGVTDAHNPEDCLPAGGLGLMTVDGQALILNGLDVWSAGQDFLKGDYILNDDVPYQCNTAHTSSGSNEPPNVSFWDDDS